ncbi:ABC transporter substrate-binding protein [Alkalispirochaeta alkalica]|uniref:ABC transporter substrate-binding protein n=1 Tax=Alkalispirochaeta alkalica TaxID=46356 RepID=UPI00037D8E43|nr:extracellular solute-binding protein [Alkalispirochaeta alkalica]
MSVKVLAVGDPAVHGYVDPELGILRKYQERQGVSVDFDILPWDQYAERLFVEVRKARPDYDVVMVAGHVWLAEFVTKGYLAPLDSYQALRDPAYDPGDIHPSVASEMSYQGNSWLVPSFTDGHLLYAREEVSNLLRKEDLCDPRRYLELAELIQKSESSYRAPLAMKISPGEVFLDWLPYLYAFGGDCFSSSGEPLFADDAGRRSLEYYLDLTKYLSSSHKPFGNEEVARALRRGEVSFGLSWGGQAGVIVTEQHVKEEAFFFVTPNHPWNVTWSFGVLAGSQRKDEAVDVLAWLSSRETDRLIGVYAGSPVRRSTYGDEDLRRRCPWFPAQERLLERARLLPHLSNLGSLMAPLYSEITRAIEGECSGSDALARAAQEVMLRRDNKKTT